VKKTILPIIGSFCRFYPSNFCECHFHLSQSSRQNSA
jgi:hypothetical protein